MKRATARAALVTFSVCMGLAIGGCGSTHPVPSTEPAGDAAPEDQASSSSEAQGEGSAAAQLHYVGTITLRGGHTTFSERFELGTLGYGAESAPPSEVLEACNANYSETIEGAAFLPAQIQMSYSEGALQTNVRYNPDEALGNITGSFPLTAIMAMNYNGEWECGLAEEMTSESLNFAPGQSLAVPAWLMIEDARSNAAPALSRNMLDETTLALAPVVSQISGNVSETIEGPDAAVCEGERALLPFAELPFKYEAGDTGVSTCRKAE